MKIYDINHLVAIVRERLPGTHLSITPLEITIEGNASYAGLVQFVPTPDDKQFVMVSSGHRQLDSTLEDLAKIIERTGNYTVAYFRGPDVPTRR